MTSATEAAAKGPDAAARNRVIGIALAACGVVAFSLRPVLIKFAYGYGPDPVTLLALRMVFALPFFLIAAAWARGKGAGGHLSRRDIALVVGLGILGYYAASFLDFLGLQYVSAGLGRLILFLYPTVVLALSAAFLGRRIMARDVGALVLSYAGLALVLSGDLSSRDETVMIGAALVFAGAASYAVYLVAGTQVIQRIGSVRFTAYAMTAASVVCIAQFLVLRPFSALDLPAPVYWISAAMAVGSTVLPVFMISEALRRIGANHVALIGALGPVSAALFGYVALDEAISLPQMVGTGLVLAGVLLVSVAPGQFARARKQP